MDCQIYKGLLTLVTALILKHGEKNIFAPDEGRDGIVGANVVQGQPEPHRVDTRHTARHSFQSRLNIVICTYMEIR